jgi:SAM-dependent methyltransferase
MKQSLEEKPRIEWRLYPVSNTFSSGDLVYVRPKSAHGGRRGALVQVLKEKATVRFENNHERIVLIKRLVPIYTRKMPVVIFTSETYPYRHLAASQLTFDDQVLEIGCSTGEASAIMMRSAGAWMGFDVSTEMVDQCLKMGSKYVFKMDVLVDQMGAQELIRQHFTRGPTAVFIDIGGNRDFTSVVRVVAWSLRALSPQLVVVKNRALVKECTESDKCRVHDNGVVQDGHEWFQRQSDRVGTVDSGRILYEHPLHAPMVVSPTDGTTPICRYHNYHRQRCRKGTDCPFDHTHCHSCRQAGHIAIECVENK